MRLQLTHKKAIKQDNEQIKQQLMQLLGINQDTWYAMRYELAFSYFQSRNFYEASVRIFILSPTFFRWWNQQLFNHDKCFVKNNGHLGGKQALKPYIESVLTLDIFPSSPIMEQIRKEGSKAIRSNPAYKNLKIY